jgi:uncharacterized protein (TIGR02452 family)
MKRPHRSHRAQLAQETVVISERGHYTTPRGTAVQVGKAIEKAVSETRVYLPETPAPPPPRAGVVTQLQVTGETTLAALRRLYHEDSRDLACLNFASAKNPGGGFLVGSEAQEESLARSSALYPCLLAGREYYERNRTGQSCLYLDLAIWSPSVPFFRDDEGTLLEEAFHASVITSPAPNAGAVATNEPKRMGEIEPTLRRRAAQVLAIAADRGVRRLVLGAWGCGVFRNDPQMVARAFRDLLLAPGAYADVFDEVVFAICDRSAKRDLINIFEEAFRTSSVT